MKPKLLAFDLDDTLAPSKVPVSLEMAQTLLALLDRYYIAVISGASITQLRAQFVSYLLLADNRGNANLQNLILFPENGSSMFVWNTDTKDLVAKYEEVLPAEAKTKIVESFKQVSSEISNQTPQIFGPQIEDRGGQITFSALGQGAPLDLKKAWDPDQAKRKRIKVKLEVELPEFEVRIGGTTSIDVTRKGIDKAYAIHKLGHASKYGLQDFSLDQILFFGDSMGPDGNDHPVKALGVPSVTVTGPGDTLTYLKGTLGV